MPIVNILKRASSYILGSDDDSDGKVDLEYEDNEILFCKNNICVHPPAVVRQESDVLHYPGYLTVTTKTFIDQYNNAKRPTLFLTWIPNATLRKCPATIENNIFPRTYMPPFRPNGCSPAPTPCEKLTTTNVQIVNTNPFLEPYIEPSLHNGADTKSMNCSDYSETISISSSSGVWNFITFIFLYRKKYF